MILTAQAYNLLLTHISRKEHTNFISVDDFCLHRNDTKATLYLEAWGFVELKFNY